MYSLARNLCEGKEYDQILPFITNACETLFGNINKAKVAKIVRQVRGGGGVSSFSVVRS